MSDIVEFLKARLDEDEAIAKNAVAGFPDDDRFEGDLSSWHADDSGYGSASIGAGGVQRDNGFSGIGTFGSCLVVYDEGLPTIEAATHMVRHDPARVLREVAAKRAIIADMEKADRVAEMEAESEHSEESWEWEARSSTLTDALKHLATAYSDHPDYRREWKA